MSIKEKVAYLKGLAEGLGLDPESKAEKLITVIIDTLADMADEIEDLSENALDIGEELDALSDDLSEVEDFLFDDDFDVSDYDDFDFDDDHDELDDECGCAYCGGASFSYEVKCPACGEEIVLDESDLTQDMVKCENCGEVLELDFDEDLDELDMLDDFDDLGDLDDIDDIEDTGASGDEANKDSEG